MKKLSLVLSILLLTIVSYAQNAIDTTPPYKRFPAVPPFRLLQTDSVSVLTKDKLAKKKAVLIILFNPECEHCKHETEEIIKHIDEMKKIQIVMAGIAQLPQVRDFSAKYRLSEFKNIQVGQDFQYMLPSFYRVHSLPYLAMYDKKGNLISTFEGSMKIEELIDLYK